jgi:hypothetical protein
MYRVVWWRLIALEEKKDKTPEERQDILSCRAELDKLWGNMSEGQRMDLDPTWRLRSGSSMGWIKVDTIVCPNCGWVHHIAKGSSGPPRCSACMMDVAIT